MIDAPRQPLHPGPVLLCAGTDPTAAARLAEVAVSLLGDRPVIVLATWPPPPIAGFESVMDALYDAHEDLRAAAHQAAERTARAASNALEAHGVHVARQVCPPEEQSPWQEILDTADEFNAGVIVAGTTEGTAAHAGALGRQARALAHRAHRPLLFVPADAAPAAAARPAIFAYDGSPAAGQAVSAAIELLRARPAVVASVWHTATYAVEVAMLAVPDEVVRKGAEGLDEAARLHAAAVASEAGAALTGAGWSGESAAVQTSHNVPAAIVATADEHDAAIVVTGTRGRSRVAATLLGSSAEGIVRHAGRPVLLVPPAPHAE
jgi:nucleotide-binding universal stress UspA family protein